MLNEVHKEENDVVSDVYCVFERRNIVGYRRRAPLSRFCCFSLMCIAYSHHFASSLPTTLSNIQDVTNAERNVDSRTGAKALVEKRNAHVVPAQVPVVSQQDVVVPSMAHQSSLVPLQRSAFVTNANSYQHTGQVDNIDERDAEDPLCVTEYVSDMYEHFRSKELSTSVRPTFMENQPHINERMRSILVDWLVEVHLKFKLVPETLYLTVNLIDRYLERKEVSRPRLQLVGVTSLLIASKYEEIYPPELRDLVYICDRAYTRHEVSFQLCRLCHCITRLSFRLVTHTSLVPSFFTTTDSRDGGGYLEDVGVSDHCS